ncbi:hypothetical protein [Streptomyces sp. NPDC127190]|uniref:hypothetical protein n=1 Tax=unclassified Streptomyces TaxID=2593676 RepID=UPI0036269F4B
MEAAARLLATLERFLGSVVASLAGARQDQPEHQDRLGPEQEWQAGLLLWTALHGLVAL